MKVLKFGGSSIATADKIRHVADLIAREAHRPLLIVVSATGKTTDALCAISELAARRGSYDSELEALIAQHRQLARDLAGDSASAKILSATFETLFTELREVLHGVYLLRERSERSLDMILSFGERLSAPLVAAALSRSGLTAEAIDAREFIVTDDRFGAARVLLGDTEKRVTELFRNDPILLVCPGFIGASVRGETTTLGRGGSDYTAAILGAATHADEVEIWTDVDGMMTADPRKVAKAFSLPSVSYEEAMELSHFGARVIHPPTLQPALNREIPIRIRNTFRPEFPGTLILKDPEPNPSLVTGISSIDDIALVRISGSGMVGVAGIAMRLFGALARGGISVILITQASSEHTICFAVSPEEASRAELVIRDEFKLEISAGVITELVVERDLAIVSVVGESMRRKPGVASKVFRALGQNAVSCIAIAQGSSELNISIVVDREDEAKALEAIHDEFFLAGTRSLNLFIAGAGLIGSTLIRQIAEYRESLAEEQGIELRVLAVANSRRLIHDLEGLDLNEFEHRLEQSSEAGGFARLAEHAIAANLPNTVVVDATAASELSDSYEALLRHSITIVTANKKVPSGDGDRYRELKRIARSHDTHWLFETCVGAGLPIISTLRDLKQSGDRVVRVEAVLSGTLSYLFNRFDGSVALSELVREAQASGLTEPDPRHDLDGSDVGRKILILAREAGYEPVEVTVESLVPERAMAAKTEDEFYRALADVDGEFLDQLENARARGAKLGYLASFEAESRVARVGLQAIEPSHPFSGLAGSDNIVSLTTGRYSERPLVVRGPGAGAEVTAAGLLADIVRIAHFAGRR